MTLLRATNLTIAIPNRQRCQSFDFSIQLGERIGILGPNGCGKTTLLHTLAGLLPPAYGSITLQGERIDNLSTKSIAKHVAILFQSQNDTFPQTVLEYITASRFPHLSYYEKENKHDIDIIENALQCMDLCSLRHRVIQQLSGGEKRRLAIAAVLAQTPRLFLLDEPTNHLDMRYQMRALHHFKKLGTSMQAGIIMSLHDVNIALAFCTHVLLMFADGSIQQGETCDILTAENLTRLYEHPVNAIPNGNSFILLPDTVNKEIL